MQRRLLVSGILVLALAGAFFVFKMTSRAPSPEPSTSTSAPVAPVTPPATTPTTTPSTPVAEAPPPKAKTPPAPSHANAVVAPVTPPVKTVGSKVAPITMEVFSDYQCPSCGALYEQTLRPMINDYVAAGKVYLVHRDFPLPMHTYGYEAARWVNAAARIGKFEEVEAALYDNQKTWSADGNIQKYVSGAMTEADFRRVQKLMAGCGVEVKPPIPGTVSTCPLDANIEADKVLGNQIPIKATPTFITYYKGQKYPAASGVISWPVMKQYFDSLLAQ